HRWLTPRYARCPAALNPWPEKAPAQRFIPTSPCESLIVFDSLKATSTSQKNAALQAAFIAACKAASGVPQTACNSV
ncbi:hypothetical protein, partial [Pseudomonas sp. O11]|uniref:hypothetical protein n=1 Tax=Pseudomonas sp. O11 TaxID=3159446 RepID=UPI00387B0109